MATTGDYITFFTLVGDISCRQVIFHVGRWYFTSSSKYPWNIWYISFYRYTFSAGTTFSHGINWRASEASETLSGLFNRESYIITRIMVTIKKRAGVIPYSFSSSIALLSSLLSCSFYLLDPRTISRVDILEMTWKDGKAYRRLTTMCVVNKLL